MQPRLTRLGIIAGGGLLPEILVQRCRAAGRPVFVAALKGQGDPARFADAEVETFRLGAVGAIIKRLRSLDITDIILSGAVQRPRASELIPDLWSARFLARTKALGRGDDGLLTAILNALEEREGFHVLAAHDLAPDLLTPAGALGARPVTQDMTADLAAGIAGARSLGRRDAGQAVIAAGGRVVAWEGPEGTEAMIAGAGPEARGGMLVKAMKPGQEPRVDLPAVGPDTVDQAVAAGLRGIAAEAGRSLTLDRDEITRRADGAGLVVHGFTDDDLAGGNR
ncbi:MAG: UDP-2,3-diacylglucosamine pyrophosphatase [Rhodospirillaceae bacterium]|nr:UDP-2,3-diacylglucosamine pyrophosphatase [Rhodospirillaceae bacterium]